MTSLVLDAGALIALERGDGRVRALLRAGAEVVVPATALAQVWRGGARQARLAQLLSSPEVRVAPLDAVAAKVVGLLLARSQTSDVVDAHVVAVALADGGSVVTSDPEDLRRLDARLALHEL